MNKQSRTGIRRRMVLMRRRNVCRVLPFSFMSCCNTFISSSVLRADYSIIDKDGHCVVTLQPKERRRRRILELCGDLKPPPQERRSVEKAGTEMETSDRNVIPYPSNRVPFFPLQGPMPSRRLCVVPAHACLFPSSFIPSRPSQPQDRKPWHHHHCFPIITSI